MKKNWTWKLIATFVILHLADIFSTWNFIYIMGGGFESELNPIAIMMWETYGFWSTMFMSIWIVAYLIWVEFLSPWMLRGKKSIVFLGVLYALFASAPLGNAWWILSLS